VPKRHYKQNARKISTKIVKLATRSTREDWQVSNLDQRVPAAKMAAFKF